MLNRLPVQVTASARRACYAVVCQQNTIEAVYRPGSVQCAAVATPATVVQHVDTQQHNAKWDRQVWLGIWSLHSSCVFGSGNSSWR